MSLTDPPPHPCPAATFRAYTDAWCNHSGLSLAQLAAILHVADRSIRAWRAGDSVVPWATAELVRRMALESA